MERGGVVGGMWGAGNGKGRSCQGRWIRVMERGGVARECRIPGSPRGLYFLSFFLSFLTQKIRKCGNGQVRVSLSKTSRQANFPFGRGFVREHGALSKHQDDVSPKLAHLYRVRIESERTFPSDRRSVRPSMNKNLVFFPPS